MHSKPLILVVDDTADNILTIKMTLKDEGYDFIEATNGIDAIKQATKYNPDVILMDAVMPNMNGFEATRKLREIEKNKRTPILMISSLTLQTDKITAIKSGVNDFIIKPFDTIELKSRCKSYINMANLNKKYI